MPVVVSETFVQPPLDRNPMSRNPMSEAAKAPQPIFTTLSHNIALHQIVTTFQNPEWHYI